jgi:hypothetical protein
MMQMRFISAQANESLKRESERFDRQRRWTLIAAQKPANTNHVYIPLNEETAAYEPLLLLLNEYKLIFVSAFDGVHNSYLQLSSSVLRMLHFEIRGHIMLYINRSMSRTFQLDQLLNEPDPEVVSLNADLVGFDEELATHLQSSQQAYVPQDSLPFTASKDLPYNFQIYNYRPCSLRRHSPRNQRTPHSSHEQCWLWSATAQYTCTAAESQKC